MSSSTISITVNQVNDETEKDHHQPPPQAETALQIIPIVQRHSMGYSYQQKRDFPSVKWTKMCPNTSKFASLPTPRHGHKAIAYKHLMVVFSGGNEGLYLDVCVYNTLTNEWTFPNVKGDIPNGRASYGAAIDGHRILIFGGTEEHMNFIDTLYELNVQRWEWTLLKPTARTEGERPCARIGHSFTLIKEKVFMFGGLTALVAGYETLLPRYLNELHCLLLRQNMQNGVWTMPVAFGNVPCPRESHSAVAYVSKDSRHNKLVIFGGMFGNRLGDLYTLDIDTLMWSQIKYDGRTFYPLPRSLHTASLIGDKMYVFGGWVQAHPSAKKAAEEDIMNYIKPAWRCDNATNCLNLKTMTWERITDCSTNDGDLPGPRAGHSAAVINNRIYIWSGRNGYNKTLEKEPKQLCYDDLWKVDVQKPGLPDKVRLLKAKADGLVVEWDSVPGADGYLLQCMPFDIPLSATVVDKNANVVQNRCNLIQNVLPLPVGTGGMQTGQLAIMPPMEQLGGAAGQCRPMFRTANPVDTAFQTSLRLPMYLATGNQSSSTVPMYLTSTGSNQTLLRAPVQLPAGNQLSFRAPLQLSSGNQLSFRAPLQLSSGNQLSFQQTPVNLSSSNQLLLQPTRHLSSSNQLSVQTSGAVSSNDQQSIRPHVTSNNQPVLRAPMYITNQPSVRTPVYITTSNQPGLRTPVFVTSTSSGNQLTLRPPGNPESGAYYFQGGQRPIFIRVPRMPPAPPK